MISKQSCNYWKQVRITDCSNNERRSIISSKVDFTGIYALAVVGGTYRRTISMSELSHDSMNNRITPSYEKESQGPHCTRNLRTININSCGGSVVERTGVFVQWSTKSTKGRGRVSKDSFVFHRSDLAWERSFFLKVETLQSVLVGLEVNCQAI